MHIPTSPTTFIDVLPFDEALDGALAPHAEYRVEDWLYVPDRYDEYRYILGTRGNHPLICVGINPSTAAPNALDPTLKSAERIAYANGYDSFLMFNVYAQRATRPDDMEKTRNEWLHAENMKAFRYLLSIAGEQPAVWAAWGAIVEKREYLADCIREMAILATEAGANWYHAGPLSVKGHPHHPLYLKSQTPLEPFDAAAYLSKLSTSKRPCLV